MNSAETVLREKKRDLLSELQKLKEEARSAGDAEVRDSIDQATVDEFASEALQEVLTESHILEPVDDALKRIKDGTYGICTACGRRISAARLEAIPWTPYCLEDQDRLAG